MIIRLLLFFILIFSFGFSQKHNADIWSGNYAVYPDNDGIAQDTLHISRDKDLKATEVAGQYQADLARWKVTSIRDSKKDDTSVRRFLYNDNKDEYKEFGWTALHNSGKMNCIDGNHFFMCQTEPNSTIKLRNGESFETKTGVFGIWLHYGLVTIKKTN